MKWIGKKIKDRVKERGITLSKLADSIEVSRQTIDNWIKGQIPRGNHLVILCRILNVSPDYFFADTIQESIFIPAHRKRQNAKITQETQESSFELAKEYALFFENSPESNIVPVARTNKPLNDSVIEIAKALRKISEINSDKPIDYAHTFKLMDELGINVIFKYFPANIKSYAFYTKIYGHRTVFVNNSTNVIDLIFPLLHESIHAVRDEISLNGGYNSQEEDFCDKVASYVQFPDEYAEFVYETIGGLSSGIQVNKLKNFGKRHGHSLHGIVKRIKSMFPDFSLNVGGADANLKKNFSTIGDLLFAEDDPRNYAKKLFRLNKNFIKKIIGGLDNISYRKLGELLGLESALDAQEVKRELLKLKV